MDLHGSEIGMGLRAEFCNLMEASSSLLHELVRKMAEQQKLAVQIFGLAHVKLGEPGLDSLFQAPESGQHDYD